MMKLNPAKLKEYRIGQQLTLAALGRKLGVSERTVWNWEKGLVEPDDLRHARLRDKLPDSVFDMEGAA